MQSEKRTIHSGFAPYAMRPRLIGCAALALSALSFPAAAGETHTARVILCSDEPEPTRDALAMELERYLTFASLAVRATCPDVHEGGAFLARFTTTQAGTVRLDVDRAATPSRTRVLPWIRGVGPIAETLRQSQVPALALVLEAMLLEFEEPIVLHTPVLPGDPVSEVATPNDASAEKSTQPEVPRAAALLRVNSESSISRPHGTVWLRPPPQKRPRTTRVGVHLGAGASFLPGSVVAPLLVLGGSFQSSSWGAVLDVRTSLDSNFAVDGRPFETRVYALALGPRFSVVTREPFRVGVELLAVGSASSYRRTDVDGSSPRHWFDLGLLAGVMARVRLFGELWSSVRGGVQLVPTAPEAQIPNGPVRSTGKFRLPVLLGIESMF